MKPPKSIEPKQSEGNVHIEQDDPAFCFDIDVDSYLNIDATGTLKFNTGWRANTIVCGYAKRPQKINRFQKLKNWIKKLWN